MKPREMSFFEKFLALVAIEILPFCLAGNAFKAGHWILGSCFAAIVIAIAVLAVALATGWPGESFDRTKPPEGAVGVVGRLGCRMETTFEARAGDSIADFNTDCLVNRPFQAYWDMSGAVLSDLGEIFIPFKKQ